MRTRTDEGQGLVTAARARLEAAERRAAVARALLAEARGQLAAHREDSARLGREAAENLARWARDAEVALIAAEETCWNLYAAYWAARA